MELREIIAAPKSDLKIGPWHSGKVPKADFPIAKKAYSLGSSFHWCVISAKALGMETRVLVIFNPDKRKYDAILGVVSASGMRILCCYQYHAGEPGWHCHATCEELAAIPAGIFRGPWVRRLPSAKQPHRRLDFQITDHAKAVHFAQDVYRLFEGGALL